MTNTFILKDGRAIAYEEYGDPEGMPILFFHGFPGSRLQAMDFDAKAKLNRCRLFGVDRPGMGGSSAQKQQTLLNWACDIDELTEHLGVEKFSIVAHSGGAPFALACAHALPDKVTKVALMAGLAPVYLHEVEKHLPMGMRVIHVLVRNVPGIAWLLMQVQQHLLLNPKMFHKVLSQLPEVDRQSLASSSTEAQLLLAAKEAFKQGAGGVASEFKLILSDWGFSLDAIQTPVDIWHGALDEQAPTSFAAYFAQKLPNATLHLLDEDGHLSTLYNHFDEVIQNDSRLGI